MTCPTCSPRLIPLDISSHAIRQDALYLLLHGELTQWERGFCKDMQRVWEPSEKQLYWVKQVCDKYLMRRNVSGIETKCR